MSIKIEEYYFTWVIGFGWGLGTGEVITEWITYGRCVDKYWGEYYNLMDEYKKDDALIARYMGMFNVSCWRAKKRVSRKTGRKWSEDFGNPGRRIDKRVERNKEIFKWVFPFVYCAITFPLMWYFGYHLGYHLGSRLY